MKNLNKILMLLCVIFAIAIFYSCKKSDKNPKKPSSLSLSYWYGSYYFPGNSSTTKPFGILFRSDGTIKVYDFAIETGGPPYSTTDTTKADPATGTYTVNENAVTVTYKYGDGQVVTGTGTFSATSTPATMSITATNDFGAQISLTNQSGSSTLIF